MSEYSREVLKKGPKKIGEDIMMVMIMEMMSRTYNEYMETPQRVIELIIEKVNLDGKTAKWKN